MQNELTQQTIHMKKTFSVNEICDAFNQFAEITIRKQKGIPLDQPGEWFKVNKDNKIAIRDLVLYFTDHEESKLDPSKGIFLNGTVGTGKTKLMQLLNAWPENKKKFIEIRCKDIQRDFTMNGFSELYQYGKNAYRMKHTVRCRERGYGITYFFDDFGEEKSSKSWGNEALVMEDILQDRWVEFENTGMLTHMTSNLTDGKLIQSIYGVRVRDRIRGMFNVVRLNGKSFR